MLTEKEHEALRSWYRRDVILAEARRLATSEYWEELEEFLHMRCLFALSRHSELPDYMLDEAGKPLFPTNLNPKDDLEKWQDAIEVGWEVVEKELGLSRDDVHRKIAAEQSEDWDRFMKSVEERRRQRGGSDPSAT
jgi:hypothetical protein